MSGLKDYIYEVERDYFIPIKTIGLAFPCCACQHKYLKQDEYPCKVCDHNLNCIPAEKVNKS